MNPLLFSDFFGPRGGDRGRSLWATFCSGDFLRSRDGLRRRCRSLDLLRDFRTRSSAGGERRGERDREFLGDMVAVLGVKQIVKDVVEEVPEMR